MLNGRDFANPEGFLISVFFIHAMGVLVCSVGISTNAVQEVIVVIVI